MSESKTTKEISKAALIISDLLAQSMQKMDRAPYAWERRAIAFLRRHKTCSMNLWTHDTLVMK